VAAGLEAEEPPQGVVDRIDVGHLVEDRGAGNVEGAAGHHPADLAFGVGFDRLQGSGPAHGQGLGGGTGRGVRARTSSHVFDYQDEFYSR
jgi:hypothetical protein